MSDVRLLRPHVRRVAAGQRTMACPRCGATIPNPRHEIEISKPVDSKLVLAKAVFEFPCPACEGTLVLSFGRDVDTDNSGPDAPVIPLKPRR